MLGCLQVIHNTSQRDRSAFQRLALGLGVCRMWLNPSRPQTVWLVLAESPGLGNDKSERNKSVVRNKLIPLICYYKRD